MNTQTEIEIEAVRKIILSADDKITEHIKWNVPSFCYNGDDRITFNLHAKQGIQLIFHRGAKVKDSKDLEFNDDTGLLEWKAKDRAILSFTDLADIKSKSAKLKKLVRKWVKATA